MLTLEPRRPGTISTPGWLTRSPARFVAPDDSISLRVITSVATVDCDSGRSTREPVITMISSGAPDASDDLVLSSALGSALALAGLASPCGAALADRPCGAEDGSSSVFGSALVSAGSSSDFGSSVNVPDGSSGGVSLSWAHTGPGASSIAVDMIRPRSSAAR